MPRSSSRSAAVTGDQSRVHGMLSPSVAPWTAQRYSCSTPMQWLHTTSVMTMSATTRRQCNCISSIKVNCCYCTTSQFDAKSAAAQPPVRSGSSHLCASASCALQQVRCTVVQLQIQLYCCAGCNTAMQAPQLHNYPSVYHTQLMCCPRALIQTPPCT